MKAMRPVIALNDVSRFAEHVREIKGRNEGKMERVPLSNWPWAVAKKLHTSVARPPAPVRVLGL